VQEASQRLASVLLGLPGHAGIRRTIEAVIRPWIHVQLDRYSAAAQSIRIGQVFFKEEIETADRNVARADFVAAMEKGGVAACICTAARCV
jgi:hypothetical protein